MSIGSSPSGNPSGVGDFLFRGISGAGLQEGIEYGCAEARYIGARSNMNSLAGMSIAEAEIPSSLDIDGYPGRRRPLDDPCKLDSGLHTCFYPGDCASGISFHTRPKTLSFSTARFSRSNIRTR
ncbi:MAG: hypothetical protein ABIS07_04360 [Dokdonella sp.]